MILECGLLLANVGCGDRLWRRQRPRHPRQTRRPRRLSGRRRRERIVPGTLPGIELAFPPADPPSRNPHPPREKAVTLHPPGGRPADAGDMLHLVPRQQTVILAADLDRVLDGVRSHARPPKALSASPSSTLHSIRAARAASTRSRSVQARSTALSAKLAVESARTQAAEGDPVSLSTTPPLGRRRRACAHLGHLAVGPDPEQGSRIVGLRSDMTTRRSVRSGRPHPRQSRRLQPNAALGQKG